MPQMPELTERAIDNLILDQGALGNGQGEQGNFETLRTVKAPESSIGEDKDKPSPGSNAGASRPLLATKTTQMSARPLTTLPSGPTLARHRDAGHQQGTQDH
ncbi:hypothetical protein RHS01_08203 [Rhizoctonia solani]|uniref:Uncharacterized protein n=1 Tax=Rhizoctonia solani TaxID=456999 RepID=A0A8H7M204_9AGAM|nr:hypothetical protein RHS01_08203 [Rhizoctonia solani]